MHTRSLVAVALCSCLLLLSASSSAVPVRVRGGAVLYGHAKFDESGMLELRGQLTDEDHTPVSGLVRISSADLIAKDASGCSQPRVRASSVDGIFTVQTSSDGELCLRWSTAAPQGRLKLRFSGDSYHGSAQLDVTFDRSKGPKLLTNLRFDPRPTVIDLDRPSTSLSGQLSLEREAAHATLQGLAVDLKDEGDKVLATATAGGDGKVRFALKPDVWAAAGLGELRLEFAGTDQLAPARDSQRITRQATVELAVAAPVVAKSAAEPTEALIDVRSRHGVVDSGVVEALLDGRSIGSSQVHDGRARLVLTLGPGRAQSAEVQLRYLSGSPWWAPGSPLTVVIAIEPPSTTLRLLLGLVVAVAAVWVTLSWQRSRKQPKRTARKRELPPGVHVVEAAKGGGKTYQGVVVDAHDAYPISGAEIVIRTPSLADEGELLRCLTDDHGRFSFELERQPDVAEIAVGCATHSTERQSLPAPGKLRIALMTRRRAVLSRFVRWARRRGSPYDVRPEATPAHVRHMAEHFPDLAAWAAEVEAAAFSPAEVDEQAQKRLQDNEPGPNAG